jgi:hypothetical protein
MGTVNTKMNWKKWTKGLSLFVFSAVMIVSLIIIGETVSLLMDANELLDWLGTYEVR